MPTPPGDLWSALQPQTPVALAPVRLETRFGQRQVVMDDGAEVTVPVLRVRIYPDELSVVTSTAGLGVVERAAGSDFWTAQTSPETPEEAAFPGAFDHRRRAAWEVLVRRVGQARAAFVADATRPGAPPAPDRVDEAATARLMPDAWVITGHLDGAQVFAEYVARPGTDPQVGPTREAQAASFDPGDPTLIHAEDGLRWLTDFDAAVALGMAAVIDLSSVEQARDTIIVPPAVTRGLDTIVVVGVREPTGERTVESEAGLFADLLSAHAANDRVAFLAQGTPTNNLTDQASGWTASGEVFAGYDRVVSPPATTWPPAQGSALRGGGVDGDAFEAALGLPSGVTAGLDGAAGREQWTARNMAIALFPATLGEVIGTLGRPGSLNGIISEAAVERYLDQLDTVLPFAREHVASFVRGRGTLPALRVGRQPYGVLPILPASRWVRASDEPAPLDRLVQILGVARTFFEKAAARTPVLHAEGDPTAQLVRVLGLSPVPHPGGYAVRDVTGRLASILVSMAQPPPVAVGVNDTVVDVVHAIAAEGSVNDVVSVAAYRQLLALTLGDLIHGTQLEWLALNGVKTMRVAVASSDPARTGWETPRTYLSRLTRGLADFRLRILEGEEKLPRDLLFLLAEHAIVLAGELDSLRIVGAANSELFKRTAAVSAEVSGSSLSVASAYRTAFSDTAAQLGGQAFALPAETVATLVSDDVKRSDLLGRLNLKPEHVNGFAGTRDAIRALADAALTDAEYTRLTSETLACASTRLDAWYTSLAAQRLEQLRAAQPTGLQVGAWGLLVDVRPKPQTPVAAGRSAVRLERLGGPDGHRESLGAGDVAGRVRPRSLAGAGAHRRRPAGR